MPLRLRAYLVTVPLVAAVLLPLGWPRGRDDFPISSYPMFTHKRERVMEAAHMLALRADGTAQPVSPDYVANGAVMQAVVTVKRAIAEGRADELCQRVAQSLPPAERNKVEALVVATSTYDIVDYFREPDGKTPLARVEHARCRVAGASAP